MTQIPRRRHAPQNLSLSPAMEDYLKAVFSLTRENKAASTQKLAQRLKVSPASATKMIKRLAESGLLAYERYQGVQLTETGRKIAVEIVRHHRLLELYLTQALGFSWDEVHEEAELLEHYISEKLEARICDFLGNPSFDPHGSPIPTLEGEMPTSALTRLTQTRLNELYEVARIQSSQQDQLQELAELGLVPGVTVTVFGRPPQGKVHVKIGRKEHLIPPELCHLVKCREAERECFPAAQLSPGERGQLSHLRGGSAKSGLGLGDTLLREDEGFRWQDELLPPNQLGEALVTAYTA